MGKTTRDSTAWQNDRIRSLRHSIQKGRYRIRTQPYRSIAIAVMLGLVIGYVFFGDSDEHANRQK